jgi:hypothetical protein
MERTPALLVLVVPVRAATPFIENNNNSNLYNALDSPPRNSRLQESFFY